MTVNTLAIRDAIIAELELAGAKNVYPEDPKLIDWESTMDQLRQQDGQYIQMWKVRRVGSVPSTSETNHGQVPIGCAVFWQHTFSVIMFFGYIEGSSEDQMQALIDSVLDYFQTKRTLGDLVFGIARPLGLAELRPTELGGVGGWEGTFMLQVEDHQYGLTPT